MASTRTLTLQLGPANAGLTLAMSVVDGGGEAVAGASAVVSEQASALGKYRVTLTLPDGFTSGFLVVANDANNAHIIDAAINPLPAVTGGVKSIGITDRRVS